MKPPPFDYVRPSNLGEAVAALSAHGSDAKVLAGGQSLMPMLAFRMAAPRVLVDIGRLAELKEIAFGADGLTLGALVRWCDIERSARIAAEHPLLAAAIRHVAHYQIRNRGTVGGSLAHADPAAEMPAIALVCDATILVAGAGGQQAIAAKDFFVGALTTVLDASDLLVGVLLPAWPAGRRWAFEEFSRRKGDFALAGVALHYNLDAKGAVVSPHIAGFGIADRPVRLAGAEEALSGKPIDGQAVAAAVRGATRGIDISADIHAPADYRAALLGTLLERALRRAAGLGEAA
ncbi:MAG: FAD binding domain-containing protein [Pseudolabrys sp.]